MINQTRFNVGYAFDAIIGVFIIQYLVPLANQIAPIPYSQFRQLLCDGKIATVSVSDRFVQGTLKEPLPSPELEQLVQTTDSAPGVAAE